MEDFPFWRIFFRWVETTNQFWGILPIFRDNALLYHEFCQGFRARERRPTRPGPPSGIGKFWRFHPWDSRYIYINIYFFVLMVKNVSLVLVMQNSIPGWKGRSATCFSFFYSQWFALIRWVVASNQIQLKNQLYISQARWNLSWIWCFTQIPVLKSLVTYPPCLCELMNCQGLWQTMRCKLYQTPMSWKMRSTPWRHGLTFTIQMGSSFIEGIQQGRFPTDALRWRWK